MLEGFAKTNFYCGEVGNGSRMKLCANYLVHVHVTAAAECMTMGQKAGLVAVDEAVVHGGAEGDRLAGDHLAIDDGGLVVDRSD